jgi:hypothetical protein
MCSPVFGLPQILSDPDALKIGIQVRLGDAVLANEAGPDSLEALSAWFDCAEQIQDTRRVGNQVRASPKPVGCSLSYPACRIGHAARWEPGAGIIETNGMHFSQFGMPNWMIGPPIWQPSHMGPSSQ